MNGMDEMAESLAFLRRHGREVLPGGRDVKPVRIGLIGCGKVGADPRRGARATCPRRSSSAVCDAHAERAEAFAASYGAAAYTDVAAMLREARCEAVVIGTPHPLHAEPAIRGGGGRRPRPGREADGRDPGRLRRHARRGARGRRHARRHQPAAVLRAGPPDEGGHRRRQDRHAGARRLPRCTAGATPAYYQSDPWRGKWDTEGGGVLVNQSPHQLDLLLWFMGPAAEVSGYWANLNHPSVEVEDTAVATVRFRNGGLGSIVTSVSQKPGLYTKVHVHGVERRLGRRRDRPRRDLHRRRVGHRRAAAERPLDHPGEEHSARGVPGRGPRAASPRSTRPRITMPCRSRTSSARSARAGRRW